MPPPETGSGILAVFWALWQTCFYVGVKFWGYNYLRSVRNGLIMSILRRRSGEIGIRTRLKIWRGSLLMSVRVRPPAPKLLLTVVS